MCTKFVSHDLQTADHLHNTTTKGRDGGALWRYFTVQICLFARVLCCHGDLPVCCVVMVIGCSG